MPKHVALIQLEIYTFNKSVLTDGSYTIVLKFKPKHHKLEVAYFFLTNYPPLKKIRL